MTAYQPPPWAPPPTDRWSAGRIVALVLGILLLLPGIGLLVGGGVLLWVDSGGRTGDFVFSETDEFSAEGYALASERIDLAAGADWMPVSAALGTARAEVTLADPGSEVFIGVAPVDEGSAYLDGVAHSVVDDLGTGPVDEVAVPGSAPASPPGEQDFWAAQVSGPGTQSLDWEPAQGDWLFVVMNADGSPGVAADIRIGATVPALGGLAWGVLATGILLTVIAVLVMALSIRRRPAARASTPYGGAGIPAPRPAEPSPIWDQPTGQEPSTRTTRGEGTG